LLWEEVPLVCAGRARLIQVDEAAEGVNGREVYAWAAMDADTGELPAIEATRSRGSMDALLSLGRALEARTDEPAFIWGPQYSWALRELGLERRRGALGGGSGVEGSFGSVRRTRTSLEGMNAGRSGIASLDMLMSIFFACCEGPKSHEGVGHAFGGDPPYLTNTMIRTCFIKLTSYPGEKILALYNQAEARQAPSSNALLGSLHASRPGRDIERHEPLLGATAPADEPPMERDASMGSQCCAQDTLLLRIGLRPESCWQTARAMAGRALTAWNPLLSPWRIG